MTTVVATFYKFVRLDRLGDRQSTLQAICDQHQVKGTILLAEEGINSTLAGTREGIDAVLAFLRSDPCFADLEHKESLAEEPPFGRMKVRLRPEIVPLGAPGINLAVETGIQVAPQDWNALITDPEVVLIDTRNTYEVAIGSFQGAQNPHTRSFRQFPDYIDQQLDPQQHPKVAMFCTGGIRCEKASAYLRSRGFRQVYQLKGGILKYLEEIPADESLWQGECFVFDERVAVKHGLELGSYDFCRACGHPISEGDRQSPYYEEGVCCPHCATEAIETSMSD
jgi:UPF0176 protein